MSREELKPKDKVVMRMVKDGAVEENLTQGTEHRVSAAPTQKIERLEKRSEKAVTSMLSILGCFEEEPPFMLERKAII